MISSSVAGWASTGQGPKGILSCYGVVLTLGEGLMVDKCQSNSLTIGVALAVGTGLGGGLGLGI